MGILREANLKPNFLEFLGRLLMVYKHDQITHAFTPHLGMSGALKKRIIQAGPVTFYSNDLNFNSIRMIEIST